jgi:hypothetical protein
MGKWEYKFEMYQHLANTRGQLYEQAKKIPKEIGFPEDLLGKVGLTGTVSENHGLLRKEISQAMEAGARRVVSNATLDQEIRALVKSYYGDEYDAVTASTCEALLYVGFDVLAAPPISGRGDNYRARYIVPYERHLHHQGSYGRPFPPKYKDLFADRGCTAGELGQSGKRLANLETVIVPLAGAKYDCHGINYHPCALMLGVDAKASAQIIAEEARRHEVYLSAFSSLGYTLPGYGYKEKDDDDVPVLQKSIAQLAKRYHVPYIVDNAAGLPFNCTDIRKLGAELMLFSMDKSSGGPTCGLAIGTEEMIVPLARGLGIHGHRFGNPISHGKATYVTVDPGKEALGGLIATLKVLLEKGDQFRKSADLWYEIVVDEFDNFDSELRGGLVISKDHNSCGVEVNYENTWAGGNMGIPIFSIEDMYAGTSLIQSGMRQMGVIPCISYDGNIRMSPGLGTVDEDGNLMEEPTRYIVRALVRFVELLCKHAGVMDQ